MFWWILGGIVLILGIIVAFMHEIEWLIFATFFVIIIFAAGLSCSIIIADGFSQDDMNLVSTEVISLHPLNPAATGDEIPYIGVGTFNDDPCYWVLEEDLSSPSGNIYKRINVNSNTKIHESEDTEVKLIITSYEGTKSFFSFFTPTAYDYDFYIPPNSTIYNINVKG